MKVAALITTFILLASCKILGQVSFLSPEDAVQQALQHNLGSAIAEQNTAIARQTYNRGLANFIPNLSAIASKNWSIDNSERVGRSGETSFVDNAKGNSFNYGFNLEWTLFDGLGMFYTYDRLGNLYQASQQYQYQIRADLTADVLQAYYSHTLQQQRLQLWESTLELSERRLQLAKDRYELGKTSKQEYLSALVDNNADQAAKLSQQEALLNARYLLNRLLGRTPTEGLLTADTLVIESSAAYTTSGNFSANPLLAARKLEQSAAETFTKEQDAQFFPRLSFNLGYNYINQNAPGGIFLISQSSNTLGYGFTASWNIFGGFYTRQTGQIARLQSELFSLGTQQIEQDLAQDEADALAAYQTGEARIKLEQKSVELSQENTAITMDRYQLGVITALELRVAQQNEQQAQLRLLNAVYNLKVAEIQLKRVRGEF